MMVPGRLRVQAGTVGRPLGSICPFRHPVNEWPYLRVAAVHCRGLGWNRAAVIAITKNVDGQGTHRRLGNSPRGVASRAASKASLSAVSDNANLIAGALAMRAINT